LAGINYKLRRATSDMIPILFQWKHNTLVDATFIITWHRLIGLRAKKVVLYSGIQNIQHVLF